MKSNYQKGKLIAVVHGNIIMDLYWLSRLNPFVCTSVCVPCAKKNKNPES